MQRLDLTNPLARVAHGWVVVVDDDARAALAGTSFARWFSPSRDGLAALGAALPEPAPPPPRAPAEVAV